MVNKYFTLVIVALFMLFSLSSCATDEDPLKSEMAGLGANKIYQKANAELAKKNYTRAINLYKILETTYPYGIYAEKGLLNLAYAYYAKGDSDDLPMAIAMIDEFMLTYPTSQEMDYAFYLRGYIYYKNDNGLLSRFTRQDLSERDSTSLKEAYSAFYQLISRYPSSKFAADARSKLNRLLNALARSEIYKARYYMNIKADLAAINRTQELIKNYPYTIFVEEALAIQVVAYKNLGQDYLSTQSQKILQLNFPNSGYLKKQWRYNDMPWYAFWR